MLYSESNFCSEIHKYSKNVLCGQGLEILDIKAGGTYSNH
jgi:hypothetical protein